jgi:hypothetical protein
MGHPWGIVLIIVAAGVPAMIILDGIATIVSKWRGPGHCDCCEGDDE